jgi:hypothetical protein
MTWPRIAIHGLEIAGIRPFLGERGGYRTPAPLGKYANFVINFCQIIIDPESRDYHHGRSPS